MMNLLKFIVFLLLFAFSAFLFFVKGQPSPSSADDDHFYDDWTECDVQNEPIFMPNECKMLLLCYQNKLDIRNAKVGRRFRPKIRTKNQKKFEECAEKMENGEWHGLRIAKDEEGKLTFESSFGFGDVFDIEQYNKKDNQTEIQIGKFFEFHKLQMSEFENSISFGAFLSDFDDISMQILKKGISPKCARNGTAICQQKCVHDLPMAWHDDHSGTNLMQIAFPATEVSKFVLNISAKPYRIACNEYEKRFAIGENRPKDFSWDKNFVNACMKVPSEKCQKNFELIGCYISIKNWPKTNPIAKKCQKYLSADSSANVAGFNVQICFHRENNSLTIESFVRLSFSDVEHKTARILPITVEQMMDILKRRQFLYIEFGIGNNQSAIRETGDGKEISGELNNEDNGIGTILSDIVPEIVKGNWAKVIHFVPPLGDDKMVAFFQIANPKFSKLITKNTYVTPNQNDPAKYGTATHCDEYGEDCHTIRELLKRIAELENCKEIPPDPRFKKPSWVDKPSKGNPFYQKPSESLLCGDLTCNKEKLQQQYEKLKKKCGIGPAKRQVGRRLKRQYFLEKPSIGKWPFPIKIGFDTTKLPDNYKPWQDVLEAAAKLIIKDTCVRFEFVEEMKEGEDGIRIIGLGGCGGSTIGLGRVGGWQYLSLSVSPHCVNVKHFENVSLIAGHELLHALGLEHEQCRNDGRLFTLIDPKYAKNKLKAVEGTDNFGFAYDFGSIMHYPADVNSGQTDKYVIITLPRFYQQTIGHMEQISFKDTAIVNRIYCNDSCKDHEDKCQNGGYLNPNDCAKCLCPDGYGSQYCDQLENNVNCNVLSGEARELEANGTIKVLKPMIGCASEGGEGCRCHWRIKPKAGTKARIRFISLNDSLICSDPCKSSSANVEIKYRADKRAQGAKLCCPKALKDTIENEYKNWIEAEKPDLDIVISAHIPSTFTEPIIPFELFYEAGDVKLTNSCKCVKSENLYIEERNPKTGTLVCTHENGTEYDCSCYGDKKCLTEEKWCHDSFICPIIKVNGIQVKRVRQWHIKDPKNNSYNKSQIYIECYKAEGGTVSFWGYQEPGTTEIIRVDEVHCLLYDVAGVTPPAWFKSAEIEHGQQDKSEQNSYHGNVSSLPFIHAPKSFFDP